MKPEHWFNPAVPVRDVDKPGLTINVSNIRRAAETLLTWPDKGPKWRKAVQTCIDAGKGSATAADVRQAFEAAAKEAGMLRGL
jgi:hypothetical protein